MKKLFVIAAAAVVALAACTKVEVENTDRAISFEVANYISHVTKANVSFGIDNTFHTNAWVHTLVDGAASTQVFMTDEEISWNSTKNKWEPSRVYFWPKTGYVNFFSYAGTVNPTTKTENNVGYVISSTPLATDDDILVAEGAYEQTGNLSTYHIDNAGVTGVPTLFHHVLSKVTFNVKLDATDAIPDSNYEWEVVVDESKFGYSDKGSVTFAFADGEAASVASPVANQQSWSTPTGNFAWTLTGNNASSLLASEVIGSENKMTATSSAKVSSVKTLFDEISVLPQDLTNNSDAYGKFSLKYTIKSTYKADPDDDTTWQYITETVTVPLTDILTYVPSIADWKMNYKYIYNIIIKPGEPVYFDPAVVEWEDPTSADKEI